jgi:hypothetical protein
MLSIEDKTLEYESELNSGKHFQNLMLSQLWREYYFDISVCVYIYIYVCVCVCVCVCV